MNNRFSFAEVSFFLVANALVLAVVVYAFALDSGFPDFYYFSIQEDEYLEWASFWAFLLAAIASLRMAATHRRATHRFPWYLLGVGLFCFIVAMEEISWGQRLFGYRPPAYFLANNFQQEFNFHNIVDTDYRKLALTLVIACYGIVLPLAARFGFLRSWFDRLGIVVPTIALLPAFAATLILYLEYPWSHSGEWVELMLGMGMLFSIVPMFRSYGDAKSSSEEGGYGSTKITLIAFAAVLGLGLVNGALSRVQRNVDPVYVQAAEVEVEAIAGDFEAGLANSRCNLHKRVYSFVEKYNQTGLFRGDFAGLQLQGLPEERAEFFLDPWNSPYWIRDRCERSANSRLIFVYSFGPNRRRDSTRTEILGDDIGAHISVE